MQVGANECSGCKQVQAGINECRWAQMSVSGCKRVQVGEVCQVRPFENETLCELSCGTLSEKRCIDSSVVWANAPKDEPA